MTQNGSIIETILKSKAFGAFLIFWGLTFLVRAVADLEFYVFNYGTSGFSETMIEVGTWIIYDVASIIAGIILFVIAAKILQSKK